MQVIVVTSEFSKILIILLLSKNMKYTSKGADFRTLLFFEAIG